MEALAQLNQSLAGRYAIEREIGRGGMAIVYLARDIKHNRPVAVKVLNPELGAVLGVGRFLAEIQVTANLQHPNLLPLFDSGDAEGLLYYVMPYIPGESLRAKLMREKQLPIDEAIHMATAVASALDYAHRHGVIHRDLKPENILLHEGQPLVADFGIALAVSNAGGDRITQTGLSLGTPQYMSPEQATGDRVVDGRTDIYSLGAITYEMLTGEAPHTGTTAQAIIARVLTDQVRSIHSSRASVPRHVEGAVLKALEKLPADRWLTAHEFADALTHGPSVTLPSGARASDAYQHGGGGSRTQFLSRRALVIAGAFVAGIAIAAVTMSRLAAGNAAAQSLSFTIDPPIYNGARQNIQSFALSPDGQTIALVASSDAIQQAYLRRLSEPAATAIAGTSGAAFLEWSPDGQWLGVLTGSGQLIKMRPDGSAAITIAEGLESHGGFAWADNATLVLGTSRPGRTGLAKLSATGGTPRLLTKPKSAQSAHGFPYVAPDGKTLVFSDWGPGYLEDDFLAIGSVETGAYNTTSLIGGRAIGVAESHLLYTAGASLLAVPFDAKRMIFTGDPLRVVEDVNADFPRSAQLSVGGTLAYQRGQGAHRLILVDSEARTQAISGDDVNIWSMGRFSPDGQRIIVDVRAPSGDTSVVDIFTFDVRNRTYNRVTSLGNVVEPDWTVDGKQVVFTTWFQRSPAVWIQPVDRSQPPTKLFQAREGVDIYGATVTPDGRGVLFCQGQRLSGAGISELLYVPLTGGGDRTPEPVMDASAKTPEQVRGNAIAGVDCPARVSPDGKWLAYVAVENGRAQLFARRFRGPRGGGRGRFPISVGYGVLPVWSRDGKRLFYANWSQENGYQVTAAILRASDNSLEVVKRERVALLPRTVNFDIAPDGNRVLTVQPADSHVQLIVTTNWLPQLRARLAGRQ